MAEKTKGQLILKTGDDRLLHLFWKNRESGAIIDVSNVMVSGLRYLSSQDLILFPGDAEFVKLKEATDGRVSYRDEVMQKDTNVVVGVHAQVLVIR